MASITKGRKSDAGTNVIEHDICEDYLLFRVQASWDSGSISSTFYQKVRCDKWLQYNIKNSVYVLRINSTRPPKNSKIHTTPISYKVHINKSGNVTLRAERNCKRSIERRAASEQRCRIIVCICICVRAVVLCICTISHLEKGEGGHNYLLK